MNDPDRVVYFNNCNNRDHKTLFGASAFFDLNTSGIQATKATNLPFGQECVVATSAEGDQVTFSWYVFLRERRLRERGNDQNINRYRVFFGDFIMAEILPKEVVSDHPRYKAFFNVEGHFKQQSTISASLPREQRPTGPPTDSPVVADLRRELADLEQPGLPKTLEVLKRVKRILKTYERPSPITRYVKRTRGSTCQFCGTPGFLMRNGKLYCEVHHLLHLSKAPAPESLAPEYLVVLCATCHRRMHYAKVGEPVREKGGWRLNVDANDVFFQF